MATEKMEASLAAYMAEKAQARKEKTDAQIQRIEMLEDDEVDGVTGGGNGGRGHTTCASSYRDKENCYYNDACDVVHNDFPDYICHVNNNDGADSFSELPPPRHCNLRR